MRNRKQQPQRTLCGIISDPASMVSTPYIHNDRYVSTAKGTRRRIRKSQDHRGWVVGFPELVVPYRGQPYYRVWDSYGGDTFETAVAMLNYKLAVFKMDVEYYQQHGKKP